MMTSLPLDAGEIHVNWRIDGGGIGITAFIDDGDPYIGGYPLNWNGDPCGPPLYFQRGRLITSLVVSFIGRKPVVIEIDAEITTSGLLVRINRNPFDFTRHLSARWGDPPPKHCMTLPPPDFSWSFIPYFKEVQNEQGF